jgi:DNA-binding winged helix-turn-helix (wHTH) protein/tetratricopeptide (TPR) repeat protein
VCLLFRTVAAIVGIGPEETVKIRLRFMAGREAYEFGGFTLDVAEQQLSKDGQCVALAPKAHDMLVALLRCAGSLVSKRQLLDLVWPDSFVEEGILAVHVAALRKAFGEGGRRFIETVPRIGYRFTAAVKQLNLEDSAPGKRCSVAVLPARPFTSEVLSGRDRATGLAVSDALIDQLGRYEQIIVRPTRAIHSYVNAEDPAAIGRSLRVDAVIDTHFLGTADRVRVSVQLIRSEDGASLWSGKFDEAAVDVIAIASVVADSAVARLGAASHQPELHRRTLQPAAHAEVYELFGRGRFHLLAASMFEVPKAVAAFRAAIDLDPAYAPAHAGLALAFCAQAALRLAPPMEAYLEARAAALRALALEESCADAQVALGAVMFFSDWNWNGAERSLKRALQLNPNHSEAYLLYGQLLEALGRLGEGLEMKRRALERDPFSPLVHLQISLSYWNQRRYDEAIDWANKALEIDPRHPHAREHLAGAYLKKGDFESYLAENLKHAELHGCSAEALEQIKRTCAGGRADMVQRSLQNASSHPEAFPAMQLALIYGDAGDMDAAFRHLERAIESQDPSLVHLAVAPQWDALRADPRLNQCLSRMGLMPSIGRLEVSERAVC